MRKTNIAIIGLGNIGCYLFKYLNVNKKILTEKNNCLPIIKYVSAKNKKKKRIIKIKKINGSIIILMQLKIKM
jgi:homoserine dehydrogenase